MWDLYMNGDYNSTNDNIENEITEHITPICSDIYISTKTIICYLNKHIDLKHVFWKLPIVPYHNPHEGIIKKQIKYIFDSENEVEQINKLLEKEIIYDKWVMNKSSSKIVQKISIGVCKKDILSYRCKKKSAFYNCFVVILRIKYNDIFREIHVKVFNTGKLEIPGIQTPGLLPKALNLLVKNLRAVIPTLEKTLHYHEEKSETVLINS